jgi:hypothetical protein
MGYSHVRLADPAGGTRERFQYGDLVGEIEALQPLEGRRRQTAVLRDHGT